MVKLPIFEDGKRTIKLDCCEFGETVLFRMPGKLRDKVDTAWYEGIWLGKDTEADESLMFGSGTMHKVRTVRRVVPSKQWNKTLHKALNVTPWDPKRKDTTDTTCSSAVTGSFRMNPSTSGTRDCGN